MRFVHALDETLIRADVCVAWVVLLHVLAARDRLNAWAIIVFAKTLSVLPAFGRVVHLCRWRWRQDAQFAIWGIVPRSILLTWCLHTFDVARRERSA